MEDCSKSNGIFFNGDLYAIRQYTIKTINFQCVGKYFFKASMIPIALEFIHQPLCKFVFKKRKIRNF